MPEIKQEEIPEPTIREPNKKGKINEPTGEIEIYNRKRHRDGIAKTKSENAKPKFEDPTIRDDKNRVVAYYNPPSLTPEYPAPQLIQLSWSTGFPLVNGVPFWERLPDEPIPYYEAFAHFRDQPNNSSGYDDLIVRSLVTTARNFDIDAEVLEGVSEAWLWNQRVQAYEDYANLLVQKQRAKKIVVMENQHSTVADKFLEKAQEALEMQDLEKVSPFVIMEWAKMAIAMKRLSLRVDPDTADDGEAHQARNKQNNGNGSIELSGENQQVQIVFNKEWQST